LAQEEVLAGVVDDGLPMCAQRPVRPGVCFSMVRRGDRVEDRLEMGLKLGMADVRIGNGSAKPI